MLLVAHNHMSPDEMQAWMRTLRELMQLSLEALPELQQYVKDTDLLGYARWKRERENGRERRVRWGHDA